MKPAIDRGQYFNGTSDYASFNAFKLHFRFTIMTWIRLSGYGSDPFTIFSKNLAAGGTNRLVFRASLAAANGAPKIELFDSDDSYVTPETFESTANAVPETEWTFIGFALSMDDDATNSSFTLWKNNGASSFTS
jgi:hypothetical protein